MPGWIRLLVGTVAALLALGAGLLSLVCLLPGEATNDGNGTDTTDGTTDGEDQWDW